jgi:hypothetical protein
MAKNKVQLSGVRYLGGHPAMPKAKEGVILVVDDAGVHVRQFSEKFVVPWTDVTAAVIEGPDQAAKRVTATRLLTIGVFAFAAKKKTSEAYLQLDTAELSVAFVVPKVSAGELRGQLAQWIHRIPEPKSVEAPPTPTPPSSVATELAQLAQLRDQGVLTDAEFDAQKAKLLA